MPLKSIQYLSLLFLMSFLFWHCQNEPTNPKGSPEHIKAITSKIDDVILTNQETEHGDWLTYGRNYKEDRYSELNQINKETVNNLGLAWALEMGTKRGIQGTPIVVDGIMFATGPWSVLWAIDVRKGEIIWEYDPKVPRSTATKYCCGVVNRGPAIYKGAIIWGTLDGRLVSVDAATAEKKWEVMTITENSKYSITGAVRIMDGKAVIGNGGAEFTARGYVTAYDAQTGAQVWRFYTVPGDPSKPFEHPDLAEAAKTWTGEWWNNGGGGGTAWDALTYDPELNTVYVGVGNGTHWNREIRSPEGGDNLYLSSIVALNVVNGEYKWHYQTTPGDTWDYTATQPLTMAELEIEGELRKVIMQAPKNGFFYVLDRTTGELLSAKPFTYINWATGVDENGRPMETEGARYTDGKTHWITPSSHGGHNWHPQSYSRQTGLVYIPSLKMAEGYARMPGTGAYEKYAAGGGLGVNVSVASKIYNPSVWDTHPDAPAPGTTSGRLLAWDPIQQKEVWGVDQIAHYNGGILSTVGGLIFQGDAEGKFSARDAMTGEVLWGFDVRSGVNAPPITYLVDGEQYITIPVGWGGGMGQSNKYVDRIHTGTFYTFKIGGTATPPEKLPALVRNYTKLKTDAAPQNIGEGLNLYLQYCMGCHRNPGKGGGAIPDLTRSSEGIFKNYEEIVLNGMLASQGMPNLGHKLSKEELADIQSFILYTADAFSNGMAPQDYATNLAKMQYLADTKGPIRKKFIKYLQKLTIWFNFVVGWKKIPKKEYFKQQGNTSCKMVLQELECRKLLMMRALIRRCCIIIFGLKISYIIK